MHNDLVPAVLRPHIFNAHHDTAIAADGNQRAIKLHIPRKNFFLMPTIRKMVERVHDHDLCAEQSRNLNRAEQARIDGFAVGGLIRPELICEGEGRMSLIDRDSNRLGGFADFLRFRAVIVTAERRCIVHHLGKRVIHRIEPRIFVDFRPLRKRKPIEQIFNIYR